jgi:hypothetical protein
MTTAVQRGHSVEGRSDGNVTEASKLVPSRIRHAIHALVDHLGLLNQHKGELDGRKRLG